MPVKSLEDIAIEADESGERPRLGLRERRKRLTAAELEAAAYRLFGERGFDAVTVDDIAAEADVSRRTFFRYFASKEDVLLADHFVQLARLREAMAGRPADEPIITALRNALLSLTSDFEERKDLVVTRARLMRDTPSLQARSLVHQKLWEDAMQEMVAARLGVDPVKDLRPGVVSAATLAAMRVAFTSWLAAGCDGDLIELTMKALDFLDSGLGQLHTDD
ncbi:MAG TPA: TetR family transcriptional regulator [Acidimicrobiia bacterium]|jgi:AcrR family transcriptional regulator|nr:TetR family transcriptional regulator [Acidimicrobiia bacterium]